MLKDETVGTTRNNSGSVNGKMRDNNGINMITLSIAVIILVIITSVLVYNAKDGVKVKTLNNLYNDIEQLNNKVSAYYIEHGDLPKSAKYENLSFLSTAESNQVNPNNGSDFYVINLSALEGVSLNYGIDFNNVSDSDATVVALNDIYIINEVSHTIYYPRGIEVEGKRYYTEPDNWTEVDLSAIPIYTAEHMSWVGDGQQHDVYGVNYTFSLDGTYLLKNDIDLSSVCSEESGKNWIVIGKNSTNAFSGTFYGNGHEIKNLYINKNSDVSGLFGIINNATLQDFKVTGTIINTQSANSGTYMGGVSARATGESFIKNCYNSVNITSNFNLGDIGGIISSSAGQVTIENCYNLGTLNGSRQIGGIVGTNSSNTLTINNCYNKGIVKTEYTQTSRSTLWWDFRNGFWN